MTIKKIKASVFIFICMFISVTTELLASSATITFSADEDTILKGNQVTITLTVKSAEDIGDFEVFVTYNDNVLEYITGSKNINGGDGILKISDRDSSDISNVKKYTMQFKGKDIGTSEISIRDVASVVGHKDNLEMSVASSSLHITVNAAEDASSDNKLSSLKISPGKLEPEFNEDIYNYSSQVESDVSQLIISAVASDSKGIVSAEGNNNLKEGQNTIKVSVLAENGNTGVYTIVVTKTAKESDNKTESIQDETEELSDATEEATVFSEQGDDVFINGSYSYKVIPLEDESILPEGYTKSQMSIDEIALDIYIKEGTVADDFVILYAENQYGERSLYMYDTSERTMQRYKKQEQAIKNEGLSREEESYEDKTESKEVIIAILSAVCILLLIIVIRLILKNRESKDDYLE